MYNFRGRCGEMFSTRYKVNTGKSNLCRIIDSPSEQRGQETLISMRHLSKVFVFDRKTCSGAEIVISHCAEKLDGCLHMEI